jgi:mono/diheme cytochrome c family protein
MKFVAGFFAALLLVIGAGAAFIFGGFYNVAATAPHSGFVHWAYHTAMHRSVEMQARSVNPPPMPPGQKIGEAFRAFDAMCTPCHGAPGKDRGVVGQGLQPPAPDLTDAAHHWKRAELFWIVKNGVKMTGMPAFGPTHSDDHIWLVVAFL